jgi:uncharacterized membrane protein
MTGTTLARRAAPLLFGLAVAGTAHLLTIGAIPRVIMDVAMDRIAATAGGWNRIHHAPPVDAANQRIVRSSPDLAYSTCALDLSDGPVRVTMGKGADYASLALYDFNTDNVFTLNDRAMPAEGVRVLVVSDRSPVAAAPGETLVSLTGDRGLVLIRRLAPGPAAFARVAGERAGDTCAPIGENATP